MHTYLHLGMVYIVFVSRMVILTKCVVSYLDKHMHLLAETLKCMAALLIHPRKVTYMMNEKARQHNRKIKQ